MSRLDFFFFKCKQAYSFIRDCRVYIMCMPYQTKQFLILAKVCHTTVRGHSLMTSSWSFFSFWPHLCHTFYLLLSHSFLISWALQSRKWTSWSHIWELECRTDFSTVFLKQILRNRFFGTDFSEQIFQNRFFETDFWNRFPKQKS